VNAINILPVTQARIQSEDKVQATNFGMPELFLLVKMAQFNES